jgi:hypothetical protein
MPTKPKRRFTARSALTKEQKQKQAACLSQRCRRWPTTQHAIARSRVDGVRIHRREFANGLGGGQIHCSRRRNASRKGGVAHGTRIFVVRWMDRGRIGRLIISDRSRFRTMIAALRRPAPVPRVFERVEDRNGGDRGVIMRVLASEMQHMRCRQQKQLQYDNEPSEGRSRFRERFGHQSRLRKETPSPTSCGILRMCRHVA